MRRTIALPLLLLASCGTPLPGPVAYDAQLSCKDFDGLKDVIVSSDQAIWTSKFNSPNGRSELIKVEYTYRAHCGDGNTIIERRVVINQ